MIDRESTKIPVLYSFRRCPYAMRARMAIAYAKCSVELREILLKDKPQAMLSASPKATVPVMVIANTNANPEDHQAVIDESRDLMFWALKQNDPNDWYYGFTLSNQKKIDELITLNDDEFKPILDKYKYAVRFPEHSEQDYFMRARTFLNQLESLLVKQPFLVNDKPSLADVAIFPFLRQFAFVNKINFDALPLPKLQAWLNYWLNSSLFKSVMQKYQPWQENDKPVIFPQ